MNEFTINVTELEGLQMTNGVDDLERIFNKAYKTIIQGGPVVLIRQNPDGTNYKFDEIMIDSEWKAYKEKVFKYL